MADPRECSNWIDRVAKLVANLILAALAGAAVALSGGSGALVVSVFVIVYAVDTAADYVVREVRKIDG